MVGRKLGVNLATARTKGNFHFVDGLTQLTDYAAPNKEYLPMPNTTPAPAPVSASPSTPRIPTTRTAPPAAAPVLSYSPKLLDFYKFLENLVRDVAKGPVSPGGKKQLCLILDDLSVLLNCGWPCREVLALVRYLKQLVAKHNGTLITLVHADGVMSEEVSQDGLVKGVFYEADYIIDVRGLDSGGSRDVHGQLSMLHGPGYLLKQRAGQVKENEWPALTLHYKILDNNVEVFAKGYSSGVLAGNKEICTLLLNAGADVDAATPELGATPLMRSIQQGHLDVSRLLVSYGASIDVRNSDHENIFHVLAIAASKDNTMQTSDKTEKSVAMALWLMTKLDKDRRIAMLTASDVKGRRPVDYLEAGSLAALLTPPN
ncbi:Elongator subunit elp6 [Haplosporangium bisporale]|nr:Elongator subunit elp6 [Haplosporangium bisporale]